MWLVALPCQPAAHRCCAVPAAQVPEGVEEPVSPATLGYKDAPSSTAGAPTALVTLGLPPWLVLSRRLLDLLATP